MHGTDQWRHTKKVCFLLRFSEIGLNFVLGGLQRIWTHSLYSMRGVR
jgi:hypothetical protein